MRRLRKASLSAFLIVSTAACDDFLTGLGLSENPNSPVTATPQQLFVASQAAMFTRMQGQLARQASIYTQQLIGTNNQQLAWGTNYLVTEGDISGQMNGFYVGGGLVDQRKVQAAARESGDSKWDGMVKIWEAFAMGTATSIWGDLPYREAVSEIARPALDPQQQIYSDLQTLLDEAIGLLAGAGAGPGTSDLVYGGNADRWRRAAYTLKARYHLHTAERLGAPAYQAALAAANQGINEVPTSATNAIDGQGPGDFRAFHGNTLADGNIWSQFLGARQDIVAGNVLIQILVAQNDPRLARYFNPAAVGPPAVYRGADELAAAVGGTPSSEVNTPVRRLLTFRQPFITWSENQLILAEAKFMTGDVAGALTHVNNVRTSVGLGPLAGPVTLEQVMIEKYIVQFQNIDVWSDYRRQCYPRIRPGGNPRRTEVPGRLPYGSAERLNNPNVPLPSAQAARNWNDPNACPSA